MTQPNDSATDVVHLISDGSATTSCCYRTPFELPRAGGHRLSVDPDAVTCGIAVCLGRDMDCGRRLPCPDHPAAGTEG